MYHGKADINKKRKRSLMINDFEPGRHERARNKIDLKFCEKKGVQPKKSPLCRLQFLSESGRGKLANRKGQERRHEEHQRRM